MSIHVVSDSRLFPYISSFIFVSLRSPILSKNTPDNFFLYANGNWMKNNPIPAGYPSWNSFMTLRLKSQEDCKTILSDLENNLNNAAGEDGGGVSEEERKVATFYKAAMDEATIEQLGVKPLLPLLELCDKTANYKDDKVSFAKCLGTMALKYGIRPFFSIDAGPDKKNSEHSIAQVSQGGIRLPDKDYYFDEDKEEQRVAYKKTMALLLSLLEEDSTSVEDEALLATVEKVYELEKNLAEAHMSKTENRDPHDTYNKMSIEDVTKNGDGGFDFGSYFQAATGKTVDGKSSAMRFPCTFAASLSVFARISLTLCLNQNCVHMQILEKSI
jgi:putative endopeptidase